MKNVNVLAAGIVFATAIHSPVYAAKNDDSGVNYWIRESFYQNIGDIPHTWTIHSDYDEAHFLQGSVEKTAYFSKEGEFIGTTWMEKADALPAAALKRIAREYGSNAIESVIEFDDNEASYLPLTLFGSELENADNYFVQVTSPKNLKQVILKVSMDGQVSFFKYLQ